MIMKTQLKQREKLKASLFVFGGIDMVERIKKWLLRFLDYEIVGEYYNYDGNSHYYKKYIKKYHFKKK